MKIFNIRQANFLLIEGCKATATGYGQKDGKVYINGEELDESEYLSDDVYTDGYGGVFTDIIVPEGYVFAMGDNRTKSADCRRFGCIPMEKIEGKVAIRFWPLNKFGTVGKAE